MLLENIASSHHEEVAAPMLIPGITLDTTPTDLPRIKADASEAVRDGARWDPRGVRSHQTTSQ